MSTIVHYIKHWDNDTRGSISFEDVNDATEAKRLATRELTIETYEEFGHVYLGPTFTITKAEVVASVQAYAGVPKAAF